MSLKRQNYTPSFKAKVALEAIREEATLAQLSSKYKVNSNLISRWKKQALDNLTSLFCNQPQNVTNSDETRIQMLHAKIGQLTVERDFLELASNRLTSLSARKW